MAPALELDFDTGVGSELDDVEVVGDEVCVTELAAVGAG